MSYLYYPGCSLAGGAGDYDRSARAVMAALGQPLQELHDWNCCGASATAALDPHVTVALSARNLALAEAAGRDVLAACAACYTNLRKARDIVTGRTPAGARVRTALAETGRTVSGAAKVRHLLEVVVREIGLPAVREKVRRPLTGLRVASYYGCQLGRPDGGMVDSECPCELDDLMEALGAHPVAWSGKTGCCGGATIVTKESAALSLVDDLLTRARRAGAGLIVTACPMCHMNLDVYQSRVNEVRHQSHEIPILYFTQLMGVAMGLAKADLGLNLAFVPAQSLLCGYLGEVVK